MFKVPIRSVLGLSRVKNLILILNSDRTEEDVLYYYYYMFLFLNNVKNKNFRSLEIAFFNIIFHNCNCTLFNIGIFLEWVQLFSNGFSQGRCLKHFAYCHRIIETQIKKKTNKKKNYLNSQQNVACYQIFFYSITSKSISTIHIINFLWRGNISNSIIL